MPPQPGCHDLVLVAYRHADDFNFAGWIWIDLGWQSHRVQACPPGNNTVRQTGNAIRIVRDVRYAIQPATQGNRHADEATPGKDNLGLEFADQPKALAQPCHRPQAITNILELGTYGKDLAPPFPVVPAKLPCPHREDFIDVRIISRNITQAIALLADVDDMDISPLLLQFSGDCQDRRNVPARSAARDDYCHTRGSSFPLTVI